jgi:hypothetical protein
MNAILNFFGGLGVQIYIYLAILVAGFGSGFYYEHLRFQSYEVKVETAGKVQEAHNQEVKKQQDIITKGVKDEYEAKLAAVRNFYSSGVQHTSSRSMPGISAAPKGTDAETAYPILAGQCAETTAQLTSLQEWMNEQIGNK